jgi:hypothetical protein
MGVALMGGWVASAGADQAPLITLPTVTLPTVTLPTVTLPTVTLPTVTTPTVTVPPVPPPPPVPPAPPAPITVPSVTLPSAHPPPPGHAGGGGTSGGGAGSAGAGSGAAGQSGGTSSGRAAGSGTSGVYRFHLARDWVSRRGSHRRTTLLFTLRKPAFVEFLVLQVAPDCRPVGRFRVRGHRGVNRVRIPARIGRKPLAPGTYKVVARAIPGGRTVGRTRLVVVDRANRGQIRAARNANSCGPTSSVGASDPARPLPPAGALSDPAQPKGARHPARHHGVLGARFGRAALSAADDVPLWVFGLLAAGVALLAAAASLPKSETVGLSASILLGAVGATILLGLTITYALT